MNSIKITTLAACLLLTSALAAQSLTPLNAPFTQGNTLQFAYTGGTGSPLDWVGIYQAGQVPGNVASTVWQYVPSATGEVEFAGTLPAGQYDAHLFCCDGYDIIASHLNFEISDEGLRSRLTFYKDTDSIRFTVFGANVGELVSIYYATDFSNGDILPGAAPIDEMPITSVNANQEARLSFTPLPEPNAYIGTVTSSGELLAHDAFEVHPTPIMPPLVTLIGTGSCGNQGAAQPTLENVMGHGIDLFLYTGDNLYIDTYSAAAMRTTYENFISQREEFQQLRADVPILATWDDHDYGCCDEDSDYLIKAQSQQIFLDFFDEPANSPRRTQQGIYTSYTIGEPGTKLQIIILDGRYFLDDKRPNVGCGINDYCPWDSPADTFRTFLGDVQWEWLKGVLQEPADLRLVATSVQFSSSYHGFESWRLFPHQRKKFQQLIKETGAEHLFFVSGDMHYSEVSKLDDEPGLYPLYDFTASAINQSWPPEGNSNRVPGKVYGDPNIGLIEIDWQGQNVSFTTLDAADAVRFTHSVPFSEMEFGATAAGERGKKPLSFKQVPSPGKGGARLVFEQEVSGEVVLFDTAGQAVRSLVIANSSVLEMTNLAGGMYVAEFRGNSVSAVTKVLID